MTNQTAIQDFSVRRTDGWIRLRTLVTLRWMMVGGQIVALLIAYFTLGLWLPLEFCFATISAALWFNIASTLIHPPFKRLSERAAMLSMVFDLVQISVILGLTGGLNNPFTVLLMTPVGISAAVLTLRSTVILSAMALASATILLVFYIPITFQTGEVLELPAIYIDGFWIALAVGVIFIAVYSRRVTEEIHAISTALTAAQASLERVRRLEAIGGLAAAAAHELGTPLATIKLTSAELARDFKDLPEVREDLELIQKQANRCREILADMSRGGRDDEHIKLAPISAVIDEASAPHRGYGKDIVLRIGGRPVEAVGDEQPTVRRDPEIVHSIRNFIQNAVGFARTTVWVDVDYDDTSLSVWVSDDGPGFPEDLINHLGDPYVTTRGRSAEQPSKAGSLRGDGYQGMGLGLFIAKTLLERTGATVTFANADGLRRARRSGLPARTKTDFPTGAVVRIVWPRERFVASKGESRRALGDNLPFG